MKDLAIRTAIVALGAGWLFSSIEVRTEETSTAFIHATVIDATGSPAMPDTTVLMTGDRITAVGRTGKVGIPAGTSVIDLAGKFVIPGLWDMHVHLGSYEDGKKTLARLAEYGITGVRDMASPLDDILRLRRDMAA